MDHWGAEAKPVTRFGKHSNLPASSSSTRTVAARVYAFESDRQKNRGNDKLRRQLESGIYSGAGARGELITPYRVVYVRFIGMHRQHDRIDGQSRSPASELASPKPRRKGCLSSSRIRQTPWSSPGAYAAFRRPASAFVDRVLPSP
jgi:hypothetical protein